MRIAHVPVRLVLGVALVAGCSTSVVTPEKGSSCQDDPSREGCVADGDLGEDVHGTPDVPGMDGDQEIGPSDGGDGGEAHDVEVLGGDGNEDAVDDTGFLPDGSAGDAPDAEDACTPDCVDKKCGDDGCGGVCGLCPTLWSCIDGVCVDTGCEPVCEGKDCGFDGCGGVCGFCDPGHACEDETCIFQCTCEGKECGGDGCGASCGTCTEGDTCIDWTCEYAPGDLTCTQILGCIEACGDDPGCQGECVASGSTLGQQEYQIYSTCVDQWTCTNSLCLAKYCSTSTAVCEYATNGELTCPGILDCQLPCADGDAACLGACAGEGLVASQAAYIALLYCVKHYCPEGSSEDCFTTVIGDPGYCGYFAQQCLNG